MKQIRLIISLCFIMMTALAVAQDVPQAINFQAIARDANNEVLANTDIMIQLTILDGSADGPQVYREIRSLTTNAYGSFSFQIGREPYMANGVFSEIDWAGGHKFLKIDYDPTATLSFNLSLGTIEFVTVPYAFAAGSVTFIDAEGANNGDVLTYNAETGRFEPKQVSLPDWASQPTKPTYDYSEIENTPSVPSMTEIKAYIDTLLDEVNERIDSLNELMRSVTVNPSEGTGRVVEK